jgi:hypothetical protein
LTQTVGITAAIGTNSISYQASTGRWSQVSAFRTFACLEEINSVGTRRRPLINPTFDKLQINHLVGSDWRGATPAFAAWADRMKAPRLLERCDRVKLRHAAL